MNQTEPNREKEESMRNPWADRWEDASWDGTDDGAMMRQEAEQAREYGTRTDSEGTEYFFRPGVGGWWSADGRLWRDGERRLRNRRSAALKNLLHEASMYRYHERTGTLHPYDSSKVDGAALALAEAIRADELARRKTA